MAARRKSSNRVPSTSGNGRIMNTEDPSMRTDRVEEVEDAPKGRRFGKREAAKERKRKIEKTRTGGAKNGLPIDWEEVAREYVTGRVEERADGSFERKYPSMAQIADKLRVSLSTISYHSRRGNWLERRQRFVLQLQSELDSEVAKSRGLTLGDVAAMTDTFISKFGKAIENDAIKRATIADLERAVKLKQWVEREAAAPSGANVGLSLEALQARHKKVREQARQLDARLAGIIPGRTEREAVDAGGEEESALRAAHAATDAPAEAVHRGQAPAEPEPDTAQPQLADPPSPRRPPKARPPKTAAAKAVDAIRAGRGAKPRARRLDAWERIELRAAFAA